MSNLISRGGREAALAITSYAYWGITHCSCHVHRSSSVFGTLYFVIGKGYVGFETSKMRWALMSTASRHNLEVPDDPLPMLFNVLADPVISLHPLKPMREAWK